MNIEIVEFYPNKKIKNEIHGTMHIYCIDMQMDIRGIYAKIGINKLGKKNIFVDLPSAWGVDSKTKEKIKYPIISFTDPQKNTEFFKSIKDKCAEYLKNLDVKNLGF